jgi:cytoskeletal protein RodZ
MKLVKKLLGVLVVMGIIGFLVWKFYINADNKNLKNSKADFAIGTTQLIKEIDASDTGINKKYLDKIIEISGNVKSVEPSDSATLVTFGDTTSNTIIQCQIDARNNSLAAAIKPNTNVTIKGKVAGISKDSDPILADLGATMVMNFCNLVTNK